MAEPVAESVTSRRMSGGAVAAIVATFVAILPVLTVIVTYAGHRYIPVGDFAVIDSRVRDVWSSEIPLLGMYSRFGWYHPGPAMFWAIAPFSLVAGREAWGTLVGAAVLQAGAIIWCARVAWQRGRLLLVLAVLAVLALSYAGIDEFLPLLRPWNPFVAFPFLPLFVLLVWSAGLGDVRKIPWVLLVGSFLVQSHIGYGAMVVAGVVWMLVLLIRRRHDEELHGTWRRPIVISAVVLAVMWAAPIVEQIVHLGDGNVVRLAEYFVLGDNSRNLNPQFDNALVGFPTAPQIFAAEFRWLPPWLGGSSFVAPGDSTVLAAPASLLYLLVPTFLVATGLWVSARARNRAGEHAILLSTLFVVVGIISLSRLRGGLTDFVFYWRITLAVLLVGACIGAVVTSLHLLRHRAAWIVTASVLSIAIVAPTISMVVQVRDGDPEAAASESVVRSLVRQIDRNASPADPAMLVSTNVQISTGVFNELNRQGRPVYVSPYFSEGYLEREHPAPNRAKLVWFLVSGTDLSRLSGLPQARELASISPFKRADELMVRRLQSTLSQQLTAASRADLIPFLESPLLEEKLAGVPGVDQQLVADLAAARTHLSMESFRYAVFQFPVDDQPKDFYVPYHVV